MPKKDSKKKEKDEKSSTSKTCVGKTCVKGKKCGITCITIASILVLLLSCISYKAYSEYVKLSTVPDLPEFDLNRWWGPNDSSVQDTSIRPYRIMFPESTQDHMRKKFELYRGVTNKKKSLDQSWSYGINTDALAQLFAHWQFKYQFREREKFLNKYDHFKTNVQGLDIHFVHVKPKVDKNVKVVPLLLLHGWPSSFREFYEAIPILTSPQQGYDFVFEVIVPSLPGFGYSQAPTKRGLHAAQVAIIMRNLMHRLGFKKYYVQGGDFGHAIGSNMATIFPQEVLGFHTNMPVNFSKLAITVDTLRRAFESMISKIKGEGDPLNEAVEFYLEESGYLHLQGTKPDTLGIALSDSPVGLAAYLVDRYMIFTDPANKASEDGGLSKYFTMTDLLDQVMIYWYSGSITSSLRTYKESFDNSEIEQVLARIPTPVPTWGLSTKNELVHQPEQYLRWKYPGLVDVTYLDHGGHYAAFELPKEFAEDVFLAVSKFLKVNA